MTKNKVIDWQDKELEDKVVAIRRVAKVVKGGRRFKFSALVVTGDKKGHVGWGLGKAHEVPEAIRKATEQAKKRLVKVSLYGNTIPHEVEGLYGASKIVILPANDGTGIIAGGAARAVFDVVGIRNVLSKRFGTSNSFNIVKSTFNGLMKLRSPEEIALRRGKRVEEL